MTIDVATAVDSHAIKALGKNIDEGEAVYVDIDISFHGEEFEQIDAFVVPGNKWLKRQFTPDHTAFEHFVLVIDKKCVQLKVHLAVFQ